MEYREFSFFELYQKLQYCRCRSEYEPIVQLSRIEPNKRDINTSFDFILYVHKQFSFISVLHTINGILSNGFHLPIRLDKRYGFRDKPSESQRNKVTRRKMYLVNRFVKNWKPTSFIYFICIKRTL